MCGCMIRSMILVQSLCDVKSIVKAEYYVDFDVILFPFLFSLAIK
jgi:hypothetical protein